jgi:hypothetical protein
MLMADAGSRDAWSHTSVVLAMIANANRDPKRTRAFRPSDFDPYSQKLAERFAEKPAPIAKGENFDILKLVFVDRNRKGV